MMLGLYDAWLVCLSILIAIFVSYTAMNLAGRVTTSQGATAKAWLIGGGVAMGMGLSSMHFVGMLAYSWPFGLAFHIPTMIVAMLTAIATSTFALGLSGATNVSRRKLAIGSIVMGCGMAAVYYTGMYSIEVRPTITYDTRLASASVVIAIVASFAALSLTLRMRKVQHSSAVMTRLRVAIVIGLANAGMHYVGMTAAQLAPDAHSTDVAIAVANNTNGWFGVIAAVSTLGLLGIALLTVIYDTHLESKIRGRAIQLEEANAQLHHLALHDSLTGLANRHLLEVRLADAMIDAKRFDKQLAVLLIDLDRFKAINDSLGHQAGDDLLREVGYRLGAIARKTDTIARLGGDEFVMLIDQIDDHGQVEAVAKRMLANVAAPFELKGVSVHVTPCIGIALYPQDGLDIETLLVHADAAMYESKQAGRNTFRFFSVEMSTLAHERLELESGLRRALVAGEFELHYQPKVDIQTNQTKSVEALVRWRHPQRGLIQPAEFIPIAEETGIIIEIGEWVLRDACRRAASWRRSGMVGMRVAVNLSARQFRQQNLVEVVESALRDAGLEPRFLELELTESAVMHDPEASAAILECLSRIGVQISIDDFGAGYSSLSYLKRFPLDKLKIDRTFIRDLVNSAEDASIVRAVISLAHSLKIKVIAGGVETLEQLEFLRQLGCDQYQGFYFSRPMPPDELAIWMRKREAQLDGLTEADFLKTHSRLSAQNLLRQGM
jgi:diguanylate cyclase (GGDEF)-like protein